MSQINWHNSFYYDSTKGVLRWKKSTPKGKSGSIAGSIKSDGRYASVSTKTNGKYKRFYIHRIVWEMHNGSIPQGMCIDHIDGNGLNNKIENLRIASLSQNQRNRRLVKTSSTGIHGVIAHKGGYMINATNKYIGWTKDFFEACCIRKSYEIKNSFCENHGRVI